VQKAMRGLEVGSAGFESRLPQLEEGEEDEAGCRAPRIVQVVGAERVWYIADAFRFGMSVDDVFASPVLTAGSWCKLKNWCVMNKRCRKRRSKI
jgi:hypothetical protein